MDCIVKAAAAKHAVNMFNATIVKNLSATLTKSEDWNDWDREYYLQSNTLGLNDHTITKIPLL